MPVVAVPAASFSRGGGREDEMDSVISLLCSASTGWTKASLSDPRSLGLWHLKRCLQGDLSTAWEDCSTAEHLLNITDKSPRYAKRPQLLRLADSYRKLSRDARRLRALRKRPVAVLEDAFLKEAASGDKVEELLEVEEVRNRPQLVL